MSERITWVDCRGRAAVGWLDADPVEFDCPTHCWVTFAQVRALRMPPGRS